MKVQLAWLLAVALLVTSGAVFGCTPPETADDDDDDDDATGDDDDTGDDDTGDDDTGPPVELEGLVYFLDMARGDFVFTEPTGAGALIPSMHPTDAGNIFSASSIDEGAGTLELLVGSATLVDDSVEPAVWEQGTLPTMSMSGTIDGLTFEAGPADLIFDFEDAPAHLWGLTVSGTYATDGSAIEATALEAMVDLAPYDTYFGWDPGSLCDALEDIGAECVDCPADGPNQGPYCIFLAANSGTCPLLEGMTMTEVQ